MNFTPTFFEIFHFTLADLVDILIVSIFFYYFFQIFKGTRAVQMLFGFAVLFGLNVVSNWWDFQVVNWIFTNLLTIGVLSIVILFQPELRRALTRIGSSASHFNFRSLLFHPDELQSMVKEIVTAMEELSSNRCGALIVFEQKVGLKTFIDTGTKLDAAISSRLIKNIFFPNSPLHDGALIINQNRLSAAGCTLPILAAGDDPKGKKFGMRHKAAKSLSGESDALVVVVSEETGDLSLAHRGKLISNLTSVQVRHKILTILQESGEQ